MTDKLFFQKDGKDIHDGIDLKCTKALAFGGECYDVFHNGLKIAEIMFGEPTEILAGYSWRIDKSSIETDLGDNYEE